MSIEDLEELEDEVGHLFNSIDALIFGGFKHKQGFACGYHNEDTREIRTSIKTVDEYREGYELGQSAFKIREGHLC